MNVLDLVDQLGLRSRKELGDQSKQRHVDHPRVEEVRLAEDFSMFCYDETGLQQRQQAERVVPVCCQAEMNVAPIRLEVCVELAAAECERRHVDAG